MVLSRRFNKSGLWLTRTTDQSISATTTTSIIWSTTIKTLGSNPPTFSTSTITINEDGVYVCNYRLEYDDTTNVRATWMDTSNSTYPYHLGQMTIDSDSTTAAAGVTGGVSLYLNDGDTITVKSFCGTAVDMRGTTDDNRPIFSIVKI